MTSLTERLTGKGTGQAMEYEEESVHNAPMAARNAIVSVAKKVQGQYLPCDDRASCHAAICRAEDPRSQSARRPAEGAQCPRHQVGTYTYGQAEGGQAVRPEPTEAQKQPRH